MLGFQLFELGLSCLELCIKSLSVSIYLLLSLEEMICFDFPLLVDFLDEAIQLSDFSPILRRDSPEFLFILLHLRMELLT